MSYKADRCICLGDYYDKKLLHHTELWFGTSIIKKFVDTYPEFIMLEGNHDKDTIKYIEYIDTTKDAPLNNSDFIKLFNFIENKSDYERLNTITNVLSPEMLSLSKYEIAYFLSRNTNRKILEIPKIKDLLIKSCDPLILTMLAKSDLVELITPDMIEKHIIGVSQDYKMDLTKDPTNYVLLNLQHLFNNDVLQPIYDIYDDFINKYRYTSMFRLSMFNEEQYNKHCNIDTIKREYIRLNPGNKILEEHEVAIIKIFNKIRLNEKKMTLYNFMENLRENPHDNAATMNMQYMDKFHKWKLEANENNIIIDYVEEQINSNKLINWFHFAKNKNDKAMVILQNCINNLGEYPSLHNYMQNNNFWRTLANNTNETALEIMAQQPERIILEELASNKNDTACNMLLTAINNDLLNAINNDQHINISIFWINFSSNENDLAIEYLEKNRNKIFWHTFLENKNENARPIIMDYYLKTNGIQKDNNGEDIIRMCNKISKNPLIFKRNLKENSTTAFQSDAKDRIQRVLHPHTNNEFPGNYKSDPEDGLGREYSSIYTSALNKKLHGIYPKEELQVISSIRSNPIDDNVNDEKEIYTDPLVEKENEETLREHLNDKYKSSRLDTTKIRRFPGINHQDDFGDPTVLPYGVVRKDIKDAIQNNRKNNANDSYGGKQKKSYKKQSKKIKKTRKSKSKSKK
jgi:hypothetical protein